MSKPLRTRTATIHWLIESILQPDKMRHWGSPNDTKLTSPVAACDEDWYRSHRPDLYVEQPYNFHKFALRWRGLSSQLFSF